MKISVCLLTKSYELKCIYFFCHVLKKLLYNGDSSKGDDGDALFIWNNWTTYIDSFGIYSTICSTHNYHSH